MTEGALRIGVPRESAPGETRVAMTPDAIRRLPSDSLRFVVETGAGEGAGHADEAYRDVGADIVDAAGAWGAEVVVKVTAPREVDGGHEADRLREGSVLVSLLDPRGSPERLERLASSGTTAYALELLPRITRAQSMDALSAMSTLAGYKAAVIAADSLGKLFPLLMTAAGTLSPARVLVLGAGVAGLQAIATARRLGAVVEGYDIRPAVKEQVESLGATFVELEEEPADGEERETAGGYARALTDEEQERQRAALADRIAKADVVISTALVPGRPAPLLITEDAVRRMAAGSVVVDLAGETGGNCALSEPGKTVVEHGVTIHAPLNLPAALPVHASQMYARNVSAFLGHLLEDGRPRTDLDDEILGACCVTHARQVRVRP